MKTRSVVGAVLGAIFRICVVIFAAYVIYKGSDLCYDYGYRIFTEPAISAGEGRTVTVAITAEMGAKEIGELLQKKGLIRDAKLFTLQYHLSEYKADVKPGIFELSTAMTAEEIMEEMAKVAEETDEKEE